MGTWGTKPYENDGVGDWLWTVLGGEISIDKRKTTIYDEIMAKLTLPVKGDNRDNSLVYASAALISALAKPGIWEGLKAKKPRKEVLDLAYLQLNKLLLDGDWISQWRPESQRQLRKDIRILALRIKEMSLE